MRQMFNYESTDKPSQKTKQKWTLNFETIPVPTGESIIKNGFMVIGIVLMIETIFTVLYGIQQTVNSNSFSIRPFVDLLGGIVVSVIPFLLAKKVQYTYTPETNYYASNFTVTLKGLLQHYRITSVLMESSEKLLMYSIGLMSVQYLLLSWWFSPSAILYTIGYFMFIGSIVLNLAKRKTALIYKGFFFYTLFQLLLTLGNSFVGYHYLNYHTILTLILSWFLAGFFKSLKITNYDMDIEITNETKNQEE